MKAFLAGTRYQVERCSHRARPGMWGMDSYVWSKEDAERHAEEAWNKYQMATLQPVTSIELVVAERPE